jgi:hypothetical protein
MPTPIRDLLADAVAEALTAAVPGATVFRARRSPPNTDEPMPMLVVMSAGSVTVSEAQSPQDSAWDVQIQVMGYASGIDDIEAERAVTALEASVVEALVDQPLVAPNGGDLTTGMMLLASDFSLYSADESTLAAGSFAATFRATIFTQFGSVSL